MANKIVAQVSYETLSRSDVAKNSSAVTVGDFVTMDGGAVTVAAAGTKIEGVSNMTKTFASNNETVALDKLSYTRVSPSLLVEVAISGGTITAVDEGKYYNLSNARTVDGTTEATVASTVTNDGVGTDSVVTAQVRLVKFISATLGVFAVV